jgi:hypothetical protein
VVSRDGRVVDILLGNGDTTFGILRSTPTGRYPSDLTAGDLDGDGRPDVLVTTYPDSLRAYLGDGHGGLTPTPATPAGRARILDLELGDFDGDGKLDLASISYAPDESPKDSSVFVRMGVGNGTFEAGTAWPLGDVPYQLVSGDFDRDGDLDLATPNVGAYLSGAGYSGHTVSVLLGTGDGTLQPATLYQTPMVPFHLEVADVNRDGRDDFVVTSQQDSIFSILLGNGDGTFAPRIDRNAGVDIGSVVVAADLNFDGKADVAFESADSIHVLIGNGDATFAALPAFPCGMSLAGDPLGFEDMDRDAVPDLVFLWGFANAVVVFRGRGDGTFGPGGDGWGIGGASGTPALADLDLDGLPDLVTPNDFIDDLTVVLNRSTALVGIPVRSDVPGAALAGPTPNPAVGQFTVAFTLARAGTASLELLDVAGRRLQSLEVGKLGAGTHRIDMAESMALTPGIYFVRLRAAGRVEIRRGVFIR